MRDHPFAGLADELEAVRRLAAEVARHHGPEATELGQGFVSNLGQLLRPSLVLACSRLGDAPPPEAPRALAALVELVHAASLLHDDVIDGAETRRGRPATHRVHGEAQAVLLGDLLLAHGLRLLAPHATPSILETLGRITRDLAQGQLLELRAEGRDDVDEAEYLEIIRLKTASFFGSCARLGALAAGLDELTCGALEAYGLEVGFAYQILDDLLDVSAGTEGLGKPTGADLANGRRTLPLLRHLELEGPDGPVRRALGADRPELAGPELAARIHSSGAYDQVVADARARCREARRHLQVVGDASAAAPLHGLLDYLFRRLERLIPAPTKARSAAGA